MTEYFDYTKKPITEIDSYDTRNNVFNQAMEKLKKGEEITFVPIATGCATYITNLDLYNSVYNGRNEEAYLQEKVISGILTETLKTATPEKCSEMIVRFLPKLERGVSQGTINNFKIFKKILFQSLQASGKTSSEDLLSFSPDARLALLANVTSDNSNLAHKIKSTPGYFNFDKPLESNEYAVDVLEKNKDLSWKDQAKILEASYNAKYDCARTEDVHSQTVNLIKSMPADDRLLPMLNAVMISNASQKYYSVANPLADRINGDLGDLKGVEELTYLALSNKVLRTSDLRQSYNFPLVEKAIIRAELDEKEKALKNGEISIESLEFLMKHDQKRINFAKDLKETKNLAPLYDKYHKILTPKNALLFATQVLEVNKYAKPEILSNMLQGALDNKTKTSPEMAAFVKVAMPVADRIAKAQETKKIELENNKAALKEFEEASIVSQDYTAFLNYTANLQRGYEELKEYADPEKGPTLSDVESVISRVISGDKNAKVEVEAIGSLKKMFTSKDNIYKNERLVSKSSNFNDSLAMAGAKTLDYLKEYNGKVLSDETRNEINKKFRENQDRAKNAEKKVSGLNHNNLRISERDLQEGLKLQIGSKMEQLAKEVQSSRETIKTNARIALAIGQIIDPNEKNGVAQTEERAQEFYKKKVAELSERASGKDGRKQVLHELEAQDQAKKKSRQEAIKKAVAADPKAEVILEEIPAEDKPIFFENRKIAKKAMQEKKVYEKLIKSER